MKSHARSVLALSALVVAVSSYAVAPAARAQSAPVEAGQSPQQSDQARAQDRSRAEDVRIGRDWKAEGGEKTHVNPAAVDEGHETVGRDWRAHPADRDR